MRLFRRRPALVPVPPDLAAVLDQIAEAYWACPALVGRLLDNYGALSLAHDALVIDDAAEAHEIAMAVAEVDGSREALLTYCTTPEDTHR